MNNIEEIVRGQAQAAKTAARRLAVTSSSVKDAALRAMADALEKNVGEILAEVRGVALVVEVLAVTRYLRLVDGDERGLGAPLRLVAVQPAPCVDQLLHRLALWVARMEAPVAPAPEPGWPALPGRTWEAGPRRHTPRGANGPARRPQCRDP